MTVAGFSDACERNKNFILGILKKYLPDSTQVLEVGSGTGQHVVHFALSLPDTDWQPTDTDPYLPGLRARLAAEAPANVLPAVELDVRMQPWPVGQYGAIFSANTLHYMSTACVEQFFRGVGQVLEPNGLLIVYGPFRYGGEFTSESNARFDEWLKTNDPVRGVRDFEWVNDLAGAYRLTLLCDNAMPANNQMLIWRRADSV